MGCDCPCSFGRFERMPGEVGYIVPVDLCARVLEQALQVLLREF